MIASLRPNAFSNPILSQSKASPSLSPRNNILDCVAKNSDLWFIIRPFPLLNLGHRSFMPQNNPTNEVRRCQGLFDIFTVNIENRLSHDALIGRSALEGKITPP